MTIDGPEHCIDSTLQVRQVVPHNLPYAWQVNAKVVVDDDISEGSDAGPAHLGVLVLQVFR